MNSTMVVVNYEVDITGTSEQIGWLMYNIHMLGKMKILRQTLSGLEQWFKCILMIHNREEV